jgi:FkbH-like protein
MVEISAASLYWLPVETAFRDRLAQLKQCAAGSSQAWDLAVGMASKRLNFTEVNALDAAVRQLFVSQRPGNQAASPVRLALLGSCTTNHLHPSIRVAGLRRGLWIETYEPDYGQYFQELLDKNSGLHAFSPTAVLISLDAHHVTSGLSSGLQDNAAEAVLSAFFDKLETCWRLAYEAFECQIIQQTGLNVFPAVLGENEHRLAGSRSAGIERFNNWLRGYRRVLNVDLVSVDQHASRDGLNAWFHAGLWHRAKQEISPVAAPLYGDLVARVLAARRGKSAKCLVLDLDNTLWGGVIGDDGIGGIQLGQGSANGEAFVAVQEYAKELNNRGIILAVNSKNDEANAIEVFEKHPEMVLKRSDIACFVANWNDKASNIRRIAQDLNIGIDSIVFLDDNPFERALVRQELPMVAVPEVGEDVSFFAKTLAEAGYFESVSITSDDRDRASQYQGNIQREQLKASSTDIMSYLQGLDMKLIWRRIDTVGLQRVVQLVHKTNQFNLTTRRHSAGELAALIGDRNAIGLQLRLTDRFGDNGIIGVIIGRMDADCNMVIDTWLMSCRVLGRNVEEASLNILARLAAAMGAKTLVGEYLKTAKNGMVKDHYSKLGFSVTKQDDAGNSTSILALDDFRECQTFIEIKEDSQ